MLSKDRVSEKPVWIVHGRDGTVCGKTGLFYQECRQEHAAESIALHRRRRHGRRSLTIIAFFSILFFNLEQLTLHWGRQVQIKTFLEVVPETEVLEAWTRKIKNFPEVEKVAYVSQKQAFERFRERLGQNADLLHGLTAQILPASLEIQLKEEFRTREGIQASFKS